MATQSPPPRNPTVHDPPKPAVEQAQPANEAQPDARDTAEPISSPSVFVNSEPMREEQVQNAVKFLSHPKVRGSPVIYRRSFLEKKGLTKEEIDEAFRRVPDPSPSAQATTINQDGQMKSSPSIQPHATTQALQPAAAAPAGVVTPVRTSMMSWFHWYHAVLAVGFLAASGAGTAVLIKKTFVPRFKSWIRKVVLEEDDDISKKTNGKPSLAEEAAAAAKAAAAAAADVAKASQEMLNSKNNEKRCFEEFMNLLAVQVQEIKSMSNAIRKLEGQTTYSERTSFVNQGDHRVSVTSLKQPYMNGQLDMDSQSVRSSSPPATGEPSVAPHPKSFMEEINDQPPNPNQQLSNPRIVHRAKPWEVGQAQNGSNQVLESEVNAEGLNTRVQDNGQNYLIDDESPLPWWQRKHVKITEVENEDEVKTGPYGVRTNGQPVQRAWVPPQPPPVAMAEAAEAIRRPKPAVPKEQLAGDKSVSNNSDVTDELQRITKISEAGGAVEEMNCGGLAMNTSEIQEEQENGIVGA
ncbi:peroxisomal membrane protein PEX14-like isoform X2 [Mangifera indica]|uniref:peroxisomal membrane protein PEX14-like isoform X2 n=1 Tax=Mangifera indica TaxID=29780 RepID=UPI001CFA21F7|nr:peroxisomal membrane protein PEX14-like isoform X2 [Mangifera indica]